MKNPLVKVELLQKDQRQKKKAEEEDEVDSEEEIHEEKHESLEDYMLTRETGKEEPYTHLKSLEDLTLWPIRYLVQRILRLMR